MRRALYREYRPRSLSEVVGQPHITDALNKSLKSGKTSHAYLFIGPRGTGKTSVARILAHEINGFKYELEDEHLDIIEIDAASNRGIDNIRSLRENVAIAPSKGKYKIYIIDEVHMLTKEAFNALLKTLEEPPEHIIFIMATTDAHKIPITITSRSQTYTFKLVNPNVITDHLKSIAQQEKIHITDDALMLIAKRGGGSFRDSISLLDQIATSVSGEVTCALLEESFGLPSNELINQLLTAYTCGDLTCARTSLQNLLEQGIKPETIAEDMISNIVINPKPELLPLLSELIEIPSSTRPEVKLLLALLSSAADFSEHGLGIGASSRATATSSLPLSSQKAEAPQSSAAELQEGFATTSSSRTVRSYDEDLATRPVTTGARSVSEKNSSSKPMSWQELLDAIKKDNAPFYSLISHATGQYSDKSLKIHISNKMVRSKIDQKRAILAQFLPADTAIEITDQPITAADPLINDLSSIFGEVQEVELEHE